MNLFCVDSGKKKVHLNSSRTPKAWEQDDTVGNKMKCFHSLVRCSYCSIDLCPRRTTKYSYIVHMIFGTKRSGSSSFLCKEFPLATLFFQLHQPPIACRISTVSELVEFSTVHRVSTVFLRKH